MIKKYKPTSAGLRTRKTLIRDVADVRPEKSLISPLKGSSGRNNGRVSSRHKQRGAKKFYRIIDFKRDKMEITAKVKQIEYDPNRGVNIALLFYVDGEKRYILAPEGLKAEDVVKSGDKVEATLGNALRLENIPLGHFVHNVELNPGSGGVIARGAGNSAQLIAKEGEYVNLKLPSGEVKKIHGKCMATIGVLGNEGIRNQRLGKAGLKRHLGNRPHVRGVAMANPTDHPHAGSYRDNGIGMSSPKSPWGWNTRGVKTRKRKHTQFTIIKDRRKK